MTNPNDTPDNYTGGTIGGAGALLGIAGGLYNAYHDRKTSKENTDKTIAAQKAEAELAYQRQVEMWHMQNAYNSPEQQMARFGSAGLNPHLIYGQGTSGNSSSTPNYQPAQMQYRYAAPAYGSSLQSIIPTLMSVGTWMQNMRQSETDIQLKQGNLEKVEQLVDFLSQRNPQLLKEGENKLSIFPYQFDAQRWATSQANAKFQDFVRESQWKWDYKKPFEQRMMSLQHEAGIYKNKLLEAQSSYTDMDITNPQAIMQMVLGGVMSLAGQQLRLSTHRSSSKSPTKVTTRYGKDGKRVYQRVDRD